MYGKHRWNLFRTRPYIWAFGAYLLQVAVAFAEFTIVDSQVLGAMGADVDSIAGDTARMESILESISQAWDNSIPYIANDVNSIKVLVQSSDSRLNSIVVYQDATYTRLGNVRDILNSHASANDANLRDLRGSNNSISSTLSSIHDILSGWSFSSNSTAGVSGVVTNIVNVDISSISNAIANMPLCSVIVTNFLTSSGSVDMSVVTNLAEFLVGGSNLPYSGESSVSFARFLSYMYGLSINDVLADYESLLANSPFGFFTYLWASALLPSVARDPLSHSTSWPFINYSSAAWSGTGSDWEAEYTIFDAYNTIGLGVLTNQASAFLSIASANTNLLTGIFNLLNDSGTGLASIANKLDDVYDVLESGSPENLDYDADYQMPEWQPQYSSHIDSNTNVYRFDDAMGVMTRNMFGNTTNQISSLVNQIGGIASSDLSLNFDFSGFRILGHDAFAGWSVATSFAGLEEAKAFFKGLSTLMFYVLDLCLVVVGCRRIQHVVIGDVGIL